MKLSKEDIVNYFPIKYPYKFIDEIKQVDAVSIRATYRFKKDEFFFTGHFPGYPVVPGAILQEAAAQTGLLALGIYLLGNGLVELTEIPEQVSVALSDAGFPSTSALLNQDGLELPITELSPNLLSNTFYLTATDLSFKSIVRPDDRIEILAEKIFFRMNKLKTRVTILSENGHLVCKGIISGVVIGG